MKSYIVTTMRMIFFSASVLIILILSDPLYANAQQPRNRTSSRKSQKSAPKVRFTSGNRALGIPLEIDNNIILMRVSVHNSKPLRFIFDTGASFSVINSQRAAELGLKT